MSQTQKKTLFSTSPGVFSVTQADEDTMASMLADFVACPPDDDDGPSASNQS